MLFFNKLNLYEMCIDKETFGFQILGKIHAFRIQGEVRGNRGCPDAQVKLKKKDGKTYNFINLKRFI